jgi:hypothetical protein
MVSPLFWDSLQLKGALAGPDGIQTGPDNPSAFI